MNKKRILACLLTIGVVLGVSSSAYASVRTTDTTERSAVEEKNTQIEKNYISDEEAVKIANKAMKDYLNKDTDCFTGTEVSRFDKSYGGTSVIQVFFNDSDSNNYNDDQVTIDAETGEIIRVSKEAKLEQFKGEVDRNKIKESILSILDKAGLKADKDIDLEKIYVEEKTSGAWMYLHVNGGNVVEVDVNLKDYSVTNFYKLYKMYPDEKWDDLMIN